jgi:hypothetical protein
MHFCRAVWRDDCLVLWLTAKVHPLEFAVLPIHGPDWTQLVNAPIRQLWIEKNDIFGVKFVLRIIVRHRVGGGTGQTVSSAAERASFVI